MDRRIGMRGSSILFATLLAVCFIASLTAKGEKTDVGTVIGIDLGTTYSSVGVYRNHRVEIIADDQGNRIIPSWVAFTDKESLIGEVAKNQAAMDPERTIFDVKRLLGRRFDDPEVQRVIKLLPYEIVNEDGKPYIQVKIKDGEAKLFSPEELSAMILTKMKETAEEFLGETIKNAVVAVPAYFSSAQRQATRDAGTIAGLNVGTINELMSAVIAYNIDRRSDKKNILVFDLGGGTFDVGILRIDNGIFDVLATNGDAHLGGDDFDRSIMKRFIELIKKMHGKDISKDKEALAKMRRECERAKRALSNQHQVRLEIESLYDGLNFSKWLARARFEELSSDLFRKTMGPVKKALDDAGLEKHRIDEIILVGGSTRIPKVQQLLKDYFDGKEPSMRKNPDEVVVYGAAIFGGILKGGLDNISEDALHLDLTTHRTGVKLIPLRIIPGKQFQYFYELGNQKFKILIKLLGCERSPADLTEIPLAPRGVRFEIIRCLGGSPACRCSKIEKHFNDDNEVPSAPRGSSPIEVGFKLDDNGFLILEAEDVPTAESVTINITHKQIHIDWRRIGRMVEEANQFHLDLFEVNDCNMENAIDGKDKLGYDLNSMYRDWLDVDTQTVKEDYEKKLEEVQRSAAEDEAEL